MMTKRQKVAEIQEILEALDYHLEEALAIVNRLKRMPYKESQSLGGRFEEKLKNSVEDVLGDIEMIYDKIDGV